MTSTSVLRCAADGNYWHEAVDAEGSRLYGPSEAGEVAVCKNCGEGLTSQVRYSGGASIAEFGGVRYHDSEVYRDPLTELATAIGAKMPFSVNAIGIAEDGRQPTFTGFFHGGSVITITVQADRDIRWYSEAASDDD